MLWNPSYNGIMSDCDQTVLFEFGMK